MFSSAVRTFTDPDAYHAAFRDMQAESVITGRGSFRADFTTIRLDRLSLQRGEETLPRTAYSAVDPKVFGIVFATHLDQRIHVNGLELSPAEIIVFRAGSEGHNRSLAACQWGSIALTHEDIATAGQTIIGRELIAPPFTHPIKPPLRLLSELLNFHNVAGHLARAAPEVLANTKVRRAIDQALTRVLILCVSEGQAIEVGSAHWRRAAAMRRLENFLEANSDRTVYAAELCAAAAVSDRTLRALCHEHLGMSPTRYLWLRRIHLARRALRMADPATTTVTEIATNYGFWELGRFSVAYRALFGESPSATLRRPPEDPRSQKIIGSPWQLPESA
jgi:AraC-like DNA-binding protein